MNERLKQLAEQSYEQKPLMVPNPETFEIEHKIGNDGAPMYHKVFNQEKFAELLVRECGRYLDSPEFIGRRDLDWSIVLKRKFGFKE